MSEYKSLDALLRDCKCDDNSEVTHTKIGNRDLGIYGGKYKIDDPDTIKSFVHLYHQKVFVNDEFEFLTEKQLDSGMITLDFDLHYTTDVQERKHNENHIIDLVEMYLEAIAELLNIEQNKRFNVYVSEKKGVNQLENKTKDGIHMLIEIKMSNDVQSLLRKKILGSINDVMQDLHLKNKYDDVLDIGVTQGTVNWQLYGSRKPAHDAYKVTYVYECYWDEDNEAVIEEIDIPSSIELIEKCSVRRIDLAYFAPKEETLEKLKSVKKGKKKRNKKRKLKLAKNTVVGKYNSNNFIEVSNIEELDAIIKEIIEDCNYEDDKVVKETHEFTMLLNDRYYEPYDAWIRVGWALANTDPRLWYSWLKFSSKSSEFDFDKIPDFYEIWERAGQSNNKDYTRYSIMYWAKDCDPVRYKEIKKTCVEFLLREAVSSDTEYDMACVLEKMYGDIYTCTSINRKCWYEYRNGLWESIEAGTTLRKALSQKISNICKDLQRKNVDKLTNEDWIQNTPCDDQTAIRKYCKKLASIALNLKKTAWKNNIMREAAEVFYNKQFINKLDKNPDLLCFTNGVIDFNDKVFREGRPNDYLSKCTGIEYIEFDSENPEHVQIKDEIEDFFSKLFPNENRRKYIWQHLASVLSGRNKNQDFNIYTGEGRNGKSKMTELLAYMLGDYCAQVPISLVTGKRTGVGHLSPEVAQLKGVRYAIMQEPSKGMSLNEGAMKQLTGGDPIQGRALFQDTITFVPQLSLCVCTNVMFDVASNDHGTWRRIRKVDFESTFNENPSKNPDEHEFLVDKDIDTKFERWVPILASLLVKIYFETDGIVEACDEVLHATAEYQKEKDHFGLYISERITKDESGSFLRSSVKNDFNEWFVELFAKKPPSGQELYSYLEKKLGKRKGDKRWHGYSLVSTLDQYETGFAPNHL